MIAVGRKGHRRVGEAIELPLQQSGWRGSAEGIQGATRIRHEPRCRTGKPSAGGGAAAASSGDGTDARLEGGRVLAGVGRVKQHQHQPLGSGADGVGPADCRQAAAETA